MAAEKILACDLGGSYFRVSITDTEGNVLAMRISESPQHPEEFRNRMGTLLFDYREEHQVAGAVIGVPGPVDYADGNVRLLPNLPDWAMGCVNRDWIRGELGIDQVLLVNDADLGALGEHSFGVGMGTADMLFIAAGTGIGAGVVINGRLLHGKLSLAEVGALVIDWRTGRSLGSLWDSFVHADSDDESRHEIPDEAVRALAVGILNLVHVFSPEVVVLGGGLGRATKLDQVQAVVTGGSFSRPQVVHGSLGNAAALKGAAEYWRRHGIRSQ